MILLIIVPVVLFLLILFAYIRFKRIGSFSFPWISFSVKGYEAGFKGHEIRLLRRAVIQTRLPEPTNVFWSNKALNRCIREIILNQRQKDLTEDNNEIHFLSQLFECKKHIEMNQAKYTRGLSSSREIENRQGLNIVFSGEKVYTSKVVEVLPKYIAITMPENLALSSDFSWVNLPIEINFYRSKDAGYHFFSNVLGAFSNHSILHIKHSSKLTRSQRRENIRAETDQLAQFSLRKKSDDGDSQPHTSYRCKLMDISESGAKLLIGGRVRIGEPVQIQTTIDEQVILLSGTIKNITYNESANTSIVNIHALPLNTLMKNTILTYVYDILTSNDTTL